MKKLIYLTTNPHKVEEANEFFKKEQEVDGMISSIFQMVR